MRLFNLTREKKQEIVDRAVDLISEGGLEIGTHSDPVVNTFIKEHPAPDFLKGVMFCVACVEHALGAAKKEGNER